MSLPARGHARTAALVATTAIVSALLPLSTAQAAPTDCAGALAPAVALSDAQPGYTGVATTTAPDFVGTSTSSWNAHQARSSASIHLTVTLVGAPAPGSFSVSSRSYVSVHGRWTSAGEVASPADLKAALALLHKASPAYLYTARELTRDEVHARGVWPSHDVAAVLETPMSVTSIDPGPSGSTVYTCTDGVSTAHFVVGASGRIDQITLDAPTGTGASRAGVLGAALRAATSARLPRGLTGAGTVTDTLTYSYTLPVVPLPSMWRSTTYQRLFTALESLHLRALVSAVAAGVALTADGEAGGHASVGAIRRFARIVVATGNREGLIQLRVGYHPGGVWIAATNPFTGARVAYSLVAGPHGTKVARVG